MQARKTPVQQRSAVTVEAIAEATIQVLLAVGSDKLTTTRVAERAGVSVGTLYQYYPNKQALLYAVLKVHMTKVADAIESACLEHRGAPVAKLVEEIVAAFIDAKLESAEVSAALYAASVEPEAAKLVQCVSLRGRKVLTEAIAEAVGKTGAEVEFAVTMMYSAMTGASRSVLEAGAPAKMVAALRRELPVLCQAYLEKALA
ncbi:TetR/AcrR family transcriptional regulator [Silvibacterium acidisoli]|uniref:TetR/AcrR family transcriptional regulator n=1 Tax=Acidobacteriaceae bacterium ZG23-2 TaxID=2883246 RepID=UPI00406C2472